MVFVSKAPSLPPRGEEKERVKSEGAGNSNAILIMIKNYY
jgi:hypothetical protein